MHPWSSWPYIVRSRIREYAATIQESTWACFNKFNRLHCEVSQDFSIDLRIGSIFVRVLYDFSILFSPRCECSWRPLLPDMLLSATVWAQLPSFREVTFSSMGSAGCNYRFNRHQSHISGSLTYLIIRYGIPFICAYVAANRGRGAQSTSRGGGVSGTAFNSRAQGLYDPRDPKGLWKSNILLCATCCRL